MESAARAWLTLSPDGASMQIHDLLANGKADAQSIYLTRQAGVHPVETLEDTSEMFRGNANA